MKQRILIVDDKEENLYLLRCLLHGNGYEPEDARNGAEALEKARRNPPDLVVSDILMPGMDGFALCREWKKDPRLRTIPFVFYTATYTDERDRAFALGLGADRFVVKPQEPEDFVALLREAIGQVAVSAPPSSDPAPEGGRPVGEESYLRQYNEVLVRKLEAKTAELENANRRLERDLAKSTRAEEAIRESAGRVRRMMDGTIRAMTSALEIRDPYTAGHERRVAELACAVAAGLKLSADQVEGLRISGYMHDLGKIAVPADILSKPGKLGLLEFGIIKEHPRRGHDILQQIEFVWPVALTTLQHHERLDGSGYPQGLAGDGIIVEARILAVADVVEAMSSHRPYRPALPIVEALAEIEGKRGVLYDPDCVDVCLKLFRERGFHFET